MHLRPNEVDITVGTIKTSHRQSWVIRLKQRRVGALAPNLWSHIDQGRQENPSGVCVDSNGSSCNDSNVTSDVLLCNLYSGVDSDSDFEAHCDVGRYYGSFGYRGRKSRLILSCRFLAILLFIVVSLNQRQCSLRPWRSRHLCFPCLFGHRASLSFHFWSFRSPKGRVTSG